MRRHGLDVDHLGALNDHVGRRRDAQMRRCGRQKLLEGPRLGAGYLKLQWDGGKEIIHKTGCMQQHGSRPFPADPDP